jgi:orotidine-5'-phosphate decarboxylase
MTSSSPVFCAIDRPDLDGALALCRSLADAVGGLKLGLEFVGANGPDGVRRVGGIGLPIFLDLKLHDIPNTVAGAVRSASRLGIAMLTVHAAGGAAMLRAARDAARESAEPPAVLGVTVLTSLGADDLRATGVSDGTEQQVLRLADLALEAGCDGLVCSPREIAALRARFGPDALLVVPGIRPGREVHDQKRTLGPGEAVALGASHLVVGRPITAAADPRAAALAIDAEIRRARAA